MRVPKQKNWIANTAALAIMALVLAVYVGGIVYGERSQVQIVDISTGEVLKAWRPRHAVSALAFSPNGKLLATGDYDGRITLRSTGDWSVRNTVHVPSKDDYANPVYSIAFSPDGKTLASVHGDGVVRLWSLPVWELEGTLPTGATGGYEARSLSFSPDGGRLAVGEGRHLSIWDAKTRKQIARRKAHDGLVHVTYSPQGSVLASSAESVNDYKVILWTAGDISPMKRFRGSFPIAFSPDGKLICAESSDSKSGSIFTEIRKASDGSLVKRITNVNATSAAFSRDGKQLLLGDSFGVRIFDLPTGEAVRTIPGNDRPVRAIAVSPTHDVAAFACMESLPRRLR